MTTWKLSATAACFCLAVTTLTQAQSLHYERVYTLFDGDDNRLVLDIDEQGHARIHRPHFMTSAGDYEIRLSPGEWQTLVEEVSRSRQLVPDAGQISRSLKLRSENDLRVVTDPEISRFSLHDQQRQLDWEYEMESVMAWAAVYPDIAGLQNMAEVENRLWLLMDSLLEQWHAAEESTP